MKIHIEIDEQGEFTKSEVEVVGFEENMILQSLLVVLLQESIEHSRKDAYAIHRSIINLYKNGVDEDESDLSFDI